MMRFIINSGARKIIKRFISFMLMIKLYEINTIKELAKAGALIAAEIDRLINAEMKTHDIDTEQIKKNKEGE